MKATVPQAGTAFGQLLDTTKDERRMREQRRCSNDVLWGEQALRAHAEGYFGPDASQKLLDRLLNAKG